MSPQTATASWKGDTELLDGLAALLQYPGGDYLEEVHRCVDLLEQRGSAAAPRLREFREELGERGDTELEELFIRTFDHTEDCALEIGWHVYGETYQRGVFMAQMRDLLRRLDIPESCELPDHISHVLKAVSRAPDRDARLLAKVALQPAVQRIEKGLQDSKSPFRFLVGAVHTVFASPVREGGTHE